MDRQVFNRCRLPTFLNTAAQWIVRKYFWFWCQMSFTRFFLPDCTWRYRLGYIPPGRKFLHECNITYRFNDIIANCSSGLSCPRWWCEVRNTLSGECLPWRKRWLCLNHEWLFPFVYISIKLIPLFKEIFLGHVGRHFYVKKNTFIYTFVMCRLGTNYFNVKQENILRVKKESAREYLTAIQ